MVIRVKRGTKAQIQGASLLTGEPAFATDTNELIVMGNTEQIVINPALPNLLSFKPIPPEIAEYKVPYAVNATAATTLGLTASRTYWIPFTVTKKVSINQLAPNVTTRSSGIHYLGIYASDSSWQPTGAPLVSASFDAGATGVKTLSVSLTPSPGVYWLCWAAGSAATVRAIALAACASLGFDLVGTANTTHYYTSGSTLPDPAPTIGYTAGSSALPAVGFNFSYE
jgi:hypothetical protein